MKTTLFFCLILTSTLASAQTPWARDCVTFWGGDIPVAERTQENCPKGSNHWDQGPKANPGPQSLDGVVAVNTQPYTIITSQGNYTVIPSTLTGRTQAIITPGLRR